MMVFLQGRLIFHYPADKLEDCPLDIHDHSFNVFTPNFFFLPKSCWHPQTEKALLQETLNFRNLTLLGCRH